MILQVSGNLIDTQMIPIVSIYIEINLFFSIIYQEKIRWTENWIHNHIPTNDKVNIL